MPWITAVVPDRQVRFDPSPNVAASQSGTSSARWNSSVDVVPTVDAAGSGSGRSSAQGAAAFFTGATGGGSGASSAFATPQVVPVVQGAGNGRGLSRAGSNYFLMSDEDIYPLVLRTVDLSLSTEGPDGEIILSNGTDRMDSIVGTRVVAGLPAVISDGIGQDVIVFDVIGETVVVA